MTLTWACTTSWPTVGAQATQIVIALVTAWSPNTNMATGYGSDLEYPCGLLWLCCDRTMDPDMAWMSPLPQVAAQTTQIGMAPMAAWPSGTNMTPGGGPDPWLWHCL